MFKPSVISDEDVGGWCSNDDRRAAIRYRAPLRVTYRLVDDAAHQFAHSRLRDLSNLGVGLIVPKPLELAALLEIELRSAKSSLVRSVLARVVHVVEDSARSWIAGCAFINELTSDELTLFHADAVRPNAGGDLRRWVRFPCNVETVCYTAETSPGERRPARILNVSAGGIGLLLPCQFAQGTLLHFELPADISQPAHTLLVRVCRVIEQKPGMWFLGCDFAHRIDDDEMRALLR